MLFCTVDHSNEFVGFYKFLILKKPKEKNLRVSDLENEAAIHCHLQRATTFFPKTSYFFQTVISQQPEATSLSQQKSQLNVMLRT